MRAPSPLRTPLGRALWIAPAAALLVALLHLLGAFDYLDLKLLDLSFHVRGTQAPDPRVAWVAIGEDCLQPGQRRSPLPRDYLAGLIAAVAAGQPRVILLDVLLDQAGPAPGEDEQLAGAIRRAGKVVLPSAVEPSAEAEPRLVQPLPRFASAALAVGYVQTRESAADGVLRRFVIRSSDPRSALKGEPAFAVLGAASLQTPALTRALLREQAVALAAGGAADAPLIDFAGPAGTYYPLSARLLLEEPATASLLTGKIVVIGSTLSESRDAFLTPFSGPSPEQLRMPGAEVQVNCVATLLAPRPLRLPSGKLVLAAILAAAVLAALLCTRLPARWGLLCLALGTVALTGLSPLLFTTSKVFWQATSPALSFLLAGGMVTLGHYLQALVRARHIRNAFSRYLAPVLVDRLVASGQMPSLGGHLQPVTVLFCDMQGFSGLSRQLSPADLIEMLSAFFAHMARPILTQGGFVDKLVGDQIMALFGVPYPQVDDPVRAATAALQMRGELANFNAECAARGWPQVEISVGLHCGEAIVGNVGFEERMDYTAMGDTIVLAQRLQSLCHDFDRHLLISEAMARALRPAFQTELLGQATPKGWGGEVNVYALAVGECSGEAHHKASPLRAGRGDLPPLRDLP